MENIPTNPFTSPGRNGKAAERSKRTTTPLSEVDLRANAGSPLASGLLTPPSSHGTPPPRRHRSVGRRSITPTVRPYEPPTERFTPPREVFFTPPPATPTPKISKSSKRKRGTAIKSEKPPSSIKKEPPVIDLTLPPPPGSPTEDPLLLTGPTLRRKSRPSDASIYSRYTPSIASTSPASSSRGADTCILNLSFEAPDTSDPTSDELPVPALEIHAVFGDGGDLPWSDSDDDADPVYSGEYTGTFRMLKVPTKTDPPSSCTRHRMEAWGRPISPYPKPRRRSLPHAETPPLTKKNLDVHDQTEGLTEQGAEQPPWSGSNASDPVEHGYTGLPLQTAQPHPPQACAGETTSSPSAHESVFDPSAVHKETVHESVFGTSAIHEDPVHEFVFDTSTTHEDPAPVLSNDAYTSKHADDVLSPASPEEEPQGVAVEPPEPHIPLYSQEDAVQDDLSVHDDDYFEEATVIRELSVDVEWHEDGEENTSSVPMDISPVKRPPVRHAASPTLELADDDDVDDSDSAILDEGVIQIASSDPIAAARAAAILKMHDYDCISRLEQSKKRHSYVNVDQAIRDARRHSLSSAGVSKARQRRRHTLGTIVGDTILIEGSPAMAVPDVLDNSAHTSFSFHRTPQDGSYSSQNPHETPNRSLDRRESASFSEVSTVSYTGEWTKTHWKLLDSCFTDERIAVGEATGQGLADVEDVSLENVVERFVQRVIAPTSLLDKADILRRVRALQRKQRSGRVAPPTPDGRLLLSPAGMLSHEYDVLLSPLPARHRRQSQPRVPSKLVQVIQDTLAEVMSDGFETQEPPAPPPTSFLSRMRNAVSSYLPRPLKAVPTPQSSTQPSLPPPPAGLLGKARQPITTPAPKTYNDSIHHRDLVQLSHVEPARPSHIPRMRKQPKRLVALRAAPLLPEDRPRVVLASRRSSGASVKELIRSYEEGLCETSKTGKHKRATSRVDTRPTWKP